MLDPARARDGIRRNVWVQATGNWRKRQAVNAGTAEGLVLGQEPQGIGLYRVQFSCNS